MGEKVVAHHGEMIENHLLCWEPVKEEKKNQVFIMPFLHRLYQWAVNNPSSGNTGTDGQVETCKETQEANYTQMPKGGKLLPQWVGWSWNLRRADMLGSQMDFWIYPLPYVTTTNDWKQWPPFHVFLSDFMQALFLPTLTQI